MSVKISESIPTGLPGKIADGLSKPEGLPEGAPTALLESQVNTGIAAMEAEARKILLEAELPSSSEPSDKSGASENPVSSDKAQLSEAAKDRATTPEQRLALLLEWTLEQLGKDWLLLLNFMPMPGEDPAMLLEKLYALYHLLEAEILNNTYGPATQREMTRLDQAFSAALNRIWEFSMKDLTTFFETFGSKSQIEWLKSGTYYLASGQRLAPKELERFWRAGHEAQRQGGNLKPGGNTTAGGNGPQEGKAAVGGNTAASGGAYQAFTQKGAFYQTRGREITLIPTQEVPLSGQTPSGGTKSAQDSHQPGMLYSQRLSDNIKASASGQAVNGGALLTPEKQGLFSSRDLQKADSFVKYFAKEGSVFFQPYFNSSHEELLGVLSAVTALKSREFCQTNKLGTTMGKELQAAADGYIEYVIKQRGERLQQAEKQPALQQKEIYKTYYYTMDKYQKYGKADMAILEGLRYAVEVFQEKKLNSLFSQYKRYGKDMEFFHAGIVNTQGQMERIAADLRHGAELLERDWRGFLKYIGKSHEKMIPFAAMMRTQRPLGTVLDQSRPEEENTRNYRLFLIGSLSVLLVIIVAVWILLY